MITVVILCGLLWAKALQWLPERWPDVFGPDPSPLLDSFILMVTLIVIWPRASVSAKRISEVIGHEVSVLDPENPVEFKEAGTIEFKNVGFAYPGSDKDAVSDISFKDQNRANILP